MAEAPHVPVLLEPLLAHAAPVAGIWLDGTFGAGGYARGLLDAGAAQVLGVDRDPDVADLAAAWRGAYGDRLSLIQGNFADLDRLAAAAGHAALDGIVLDLGVSSMQLDQAERGFSFRHDGPLDMRMAQAGSSAADLVNTLSEKALADILYIFGEERASRRIARAIVARRPFTRTRALAEVIEAALPRPRPGQVHPATRSFQALRIAVNDELGALAQGLAAAERALAPGGILAVVTFHSLEDRLVKRFLRDRSGGAGRGSRHAPETQQDPPRFALVTRKAVAPDEAETVRNPRARSAKLRMARRTAAPAGALPDLGAPDLSRIMDDRR
ncbi:MAG: 16S rRNA (cytosine(1402)-N(4))-methyltransferase RsmH [Pseudomonadota bacterium]